MEVTLGYTTELGPLWTKDRDRGLRLSRVTVTPRDDMLLAVIHRVMIVEPIQ